MDAENTTIKALTKDETKTLVCLVQQSKIINNKSTNATNMIKTAEWDRIAKEFNSSISSCRRTAQQLRLKWKNLKKNARRRSAMIRMYEMETGGGDHVPPDVILDTVSSMLGSTIEGSTVEFGDVEITHARDNNARIQLPVTTEAPEVSVVIKQQNNEEMVDDNTEIMDMDPENTKGKALTKDETKTLLCLVQQSKIIINKSTNAATNKLKTEEWDRIAEEFNSSISSCRRTTQQLRLKWENLKQNARRRSAIIRRNQTKAGGGIPDYVPPNVILDTVSSILESTVEESTDEFGDVETTQSHDNNERIQLPVITAAPEVSVVIKQLNNEVVDDNTEIMDMDTDVNTKGKALTKDETKTLVCLVQQSKIINNKSTNATTNKLKTEEWDRIAEEFNSSISSCRRTAQQLRLKWENLKKNARRRSAMIRMYEMETGGGDYVPPDEILDTVSTMLGSTVEGVEFGGDVETTHAHESISRIQVPVVTEAPEVSVVIKQENIEEVIEDSDDDVFQPNNDDNAFKANGSKRRLDTENDDGKKERNLAMAAYYTAKTKFLEEHMVLQNEKLKLEIQVLKNKLNNN